MFYTKLRAKNTYSNHGFKGNVLNRHTIIKLRLFLIQLKNE